MTGWDHCLVEALPSWRCPRDSGSSRPHPPTDVLPVAITLVGSRGKNRDNPHSDAVTPARPSTTSLHQGKNLPEPHDSTARRNPSHHTDRQPPTGKRASRIRFPVQKSCCLRASRWRQHDSIRGKRPDSAGAHEVVLWQLAVQEEVVDGCGDALVAADVGDMGITVPGQQLGGVELLG